MEWKAFYKLEPWGCPVEDLRAALVAVQAGRASGWPKGKKVGVDTFMAAALLSLADDAEADRYDAARAEGRRRDPRELADAIRSFFRTRAKVMPKKGP